MYHSKYPLALVIVPFTSFEVNVVQDGEIVEVEIWLQVLAARGKVIVELLVINTWARLLIVVEYVYHLDVLVALKVTSEAIYFLSNQLFPEMLL